MKRKPIVNSTASAILRVRLENHLTKVFTEERICQYLAIDDYGTEMQLANSCQASTLALPRIKLAFQLWSGMCVADRHAVLGKFHSLYAGDQKTLIFCALFVHELANILAEVMEWPD